MTGSADSSTINFRPWAMPINASPEIDTEHVERVVREAFQGVLDRDREAVILSGSARLSVVDPVTREERVLGETEEFSYEQYRRYADRMNRLRFGEQYGRFFDPGEEEEISEHQRPLQERLSFPRGNPQPRYQILYPASQQMPLTLEMDDDIRDHIRRNKWELSFLQEKEEDRDIKIPYDGTVEIQEMLLAEKTISLKEVARLVPAGVLGLHYEDGKPSSLILHAEREDDPSKRALKNQGWFDLKGVDGVMWAAATLEAYNTLLETDLEFDPSAKVEKWLYRAEKIDDFRRSELFGGNCPLFDYQKEGVLFLKDRDRAMLSLSPGLGKTLTSAYAASLVGSKKVLLVCPASLLHYWHGELEKWSRFLPLYPYGEVWHKGADSVPDTLPPGLQFWAITNPETLVRHTADFNECKFDHMIVDESIMYKHRESHRSQVVRGIAETIPKVWLLTGAPATRYLDDMWHQFHILKPRSYSSYWRFAERYCVVETTPWAKNVIANRRGAEQRIKDNFADVYFARSQEQVTDIPDWLMEDVDIVMQPKQEAVYRKLRKELKIEIGDRDDREVLTVNNRLSLMTRSLQVASNPVLVGSVNSSGKWTALPELMEVYPGPYIVWVNFVRTGEMLLEMLKNQRVTKTHGSSSMRVCLANGSTSMKDRNRLVDDFQAGKYDVIILNDTVGKFGFNLTRARTSFFVERAYNDSYFQCLYRNRRIGTTESPIVVNMRSVTKRGFTGRTIDHVVHDALDYRNGMIRNITIGDLRGILEDEPDEI